MAQDLLADRVKETLSNFSGPGTVTLAGTAAPGGFQTFLQGLGSSPRSGVICIEDATNSLFEVAHGVWDGGSTFTRAAVESSSNAGSAVNFPAGPKTISFVASATHVNGKSQTIITEDLTGTKNGTNDSFTVPTTPTSWCAIYWGPTRLREGVGYTRVGANVTMLSGYIPQTGDELYADHD